MNTAISMRPLAVHQFRRSAWLDYYLIRSFFTSFLLALAFFVMIVQIMDLFANIFRYMQNDVPLKAILRVMVYYLPKSLSYALPIAVLFAVSYSLGNLYANNELIVIYASGVSLSSFLVPVMISALVLSVSSFFFEDTIVLPATDAKSRLSRNLLSVRETDFNASDLVILGEGKRFIWNIAFYNDETKELSGIILIERDKDGQFVSRLNAQSGQWDGNIWNFRAVRRFYWEDGFLKEAVHSQWSSPDINEDPISFRGRGKELEHMNLAELRFFIDFLGRAGLPSAAARVEYLRRFSFSATPLVVMLLAAVFAGRVKKNILLMSLLFSLISATVYYVVQMVAVILAKNEFISPIVGAFAAIVLLVVFSLPLILMRKA